MKIVRLTQRKHDAYTFGICVGPFFVYNWWYNSTHNNIVPPCQFAGGKKHPVVKGAGVHFGRLRNMVAKMVELGWTEYDSDDMLLPDDRTHRVDTIIPPTEGDTDDCETPTGEGSLEFLDQPDGEA